MCGLALSIVKTRREIGFRDFPSCPVVKIPYCQCRRCSFHLWKGTKIPYVLLCGQMIKKNKIRYRVLFSSTAGWSKDLKEGAVK